ncbi:hypothetical protein ACFXPY_45080 [Streptomyces sp. NPDC059153]|uniref:hypothetical protein n=1 Tax=Streptomyces sp. NPDC059153 TaxID=3346743 RepID=UPI00367A5236
MSDDTPRTPDGAKLCAWCGGSIRQTGVGRSKDYCKRLCREQAYRKRRDQRLIDEALAAAASNSSTGETISPVDETRVSPVDEMLSVQVSPAVPAPAPPVAEAPPAPAPVPPARRRRRAGMTAGATPPAEPEQAAMPLWEDPEIEDRLARYGIGVEGQELPTSGE